MSFENYRFRFKQVNKTYGECGILLVLLVYFYFFLFFFWCRTYMYGRIPVYACCACVGERWYDKYGVVMYDLLAC